MIKYIRRTDGSVPDAIQNAIEDPAYAEGMRGFFNSFPEKHRERFEGKHLSATALNKSPRQRLLFARHSHKVEHDIMAGFWAMFGRVMHFILEQYGDPEDIIENRFFRVYKGWLIHAQVDIYQKEYARVCDWKTSKAEAMLYDDKEDYIAQLNVGAWIVRNAHGRYDPETEEFVLKEDPLPVEEIENTYIFRNFAAKYVSDKEGHRYPKEEVLTAPVVMWSDEKVEAYLDKKIEEEEEARGLPDDELPFCTAKQMWARPDIFKVFKLDPKTKKPQSRAKTTCDTRIEAEDWIADPKNVTDAKGVKHKHIIQVIPGENVRCSYCDIAAFCNQRKQELKEKQHDQEETSR